MQDSKLDQWEKTEFSGEYDDAETMLNGFFNLEFMPGSEKINLDDILSKVRMANTVNEMDLSVTKSERLFLGLLAHSKHLIGSEDQVHDHA